MTDVFFDTEFYTHGDRIELISIGAVRSDGLGLYAQVKEFDWNKVPEDDWLHDNVKPHLDSEYTPTEEIRKMLIAFAGSRPKFWAYFAAYDWVAMCMLFGGMLNLPKGWPKFVRDIRQYQDMVDPGMRLPEQTPHLKHHALHDAEWDKKAFEAIKRRELQIKQCTTYRGPEAGALDHFRRLSD